MPGWLIKLIGSGAVASLLIAVLGFGYDRAVQSDMTKAQVLWEQRVNAQKEEIANLRARLDGKQISAFEAYIDNRDRIRTIEHVSREEVIKYAQTDDGRSECLPAERVRGIEGFAQTIGLAFAGTGPSAAAAGD